MQDNKFSNNFYNTIGVDFVSGVFDVEAEEYDARGQKDQAADRKPADNLVGHCWAGPIPHYYK